MNCCPQLFIWRPHEYVFFPLFFTMFDAALGRLSLVFYREDRLKKMLVMNSPQNDLSQNASSMYVGPGQINRKLYSLLLVNNI